MLLIQIIVLLTILCLAVLATAIGYRKNKIKSKSNNMKEKNPTNSKYFYIIIFSFIMFLTLFRAPQVGVDYGAYLYTNNAFMKVNFLQLADVPGVSMEYGLMILIKICSYIRLDLLPFIFITTLTVLYVYFREIKKYSKIAWLSVFLLFGFASYFTIFNTISQYFVCALCFLVSVFLYERKFWRYAALIIVIAFFHKSALMMIPAYFLLTYVPKKDRKTYIIGCVSLVLVLLSFIFFNEIVTIATHTIYPEYETLVNDYGGLSYLIVARPLFILFFLFVNRRHIDFKDKKTSVWINATIIFFALTLLSVKLSLLQRFTYFFSPYTILLMPNVVYQIKSKRIRYINVAIIISAVLGYTAITSMVDPVNFSFLWDN